MGRGNSLTDHEKGMIDAFEKDGHSQREKMEFTMFCKYNITPFFPERDVLIGLTKSCLYTMFLPWRSFLSLWIFNITAIF